MCCSFDHYVSRKVQIGSKLQIELGLFVRDIAQHRKVIRYFFDMKGDLFF